MTYLTNEEWAIRKNYASMAAYTLDGNTFPNATTLTAKREDAYALIVEGTSSAPAQSNFMRALEYEVVEIMFDNEQDRSTEQQRNNRVVRFIRDALSDNTKQEVAADDSDGYNIGVGY